MYDMLTKTYGYAWPPLSLDATDDLQEALLLLFPTPQHSFMYGRTRMYSFSANSLNSSEELAQNRVYRFFWGIKLRLNQGLGQACALILKSSH